MPFRFIREDAIKYPREVVEKHLLRFKPMNYNRFMWWRSHTDGNIPLSKKSPLKDRIENGDFGESSYKWQAQLALYNALDKVDLKTHSCHNQLEILQVDLARYKRLMEDFNKEESSRLESLYKSFTSKFQITKDDLIDLLCEWSGDLVSFYIYMCKNYDTNITKTNKRGRPKKT